jgi:hypothetical protein
MEDTSKSFVNVLAAHRIGLVAVYHTKAFDVVHELEVIEGARRQLLNRR